MQADPAVRPTFECARLLSEDKTWPPSAEAMAGRRDVVMQLGVPADCYSDDIIRDEALALMYSSVSGSLFMMAWSREEGCLDALRKMGIGDDTWLQEEFFVFCVHSTLLHSHRVGLNPWTATAFTSMVNGPATRMSHSTETSATR